MNTEERETQTGALAGRTALVTGAAGGIGEAIVRALLARGARVYGLDRDGAGLQHLQGSLSQANLAEGFVPCQLDLGDRVDTDRVLTALLGEDLAGGCDILVNGAGICRIHDLADSDDRLLDETFAINFAGAFRITRALLPALKASGRASVINVASELALIGQPHYSVYSASKGALLAMSRALAVELAPARIRVNAVCPGPVDTAMLAAEFEVSGDAAAARKGEIGAVPLGRLGAPGDIASVVAFLAGDEAAFVTGAVWPVDGGKTAA